MKFISGLAAAALGVLTMFCLFGMWSIPNVSLSGISWTPKGAFALNDSVYSIVKESYAKINTAAVFGLITFIVGCLMAAVFLLEFLGILKGTNAKYAAFGVGALLFVMTLLTLIFGIVAVNEFKAGDEKTLKLAYGGIMAIIFGMLGGLCGIYYGTKIDTKKKKKK